MQSPTRVADAHTDRTARMTFLANLGHSHYNCPTAKNRTDGKVFKINSFHQEVFPEIPILDLCTPGVKGLHFIIGEKAHLTVPFPGMCVSLDAEILFKKRFWYRSLLRPLLRADADRAYDSSDLSSLFHFCSFLFYLFKLFKFFNFNSRSFLILVSLSVRSLLPADFFLLSSNRAHSCFFRNLFRHFKAMGVRFFVDCPVQSFSQYSVHLPFGES